MERLRTLLAGLTRLAKGGQVPTKPLGGAHVDACPADSVQAMEKVAIAIFDRETRSQATTLRDLPRFAGLSQPEALVALGRLEKAGSVRIDSHIDDAFASTVTLTDPARAWLRKRISAKGHA